LKVKDGMKFEGSINIWFCKDCWC